MSADSFRLSTSGPDPIPSMSGGTTVSTALLTLRRVAVLLLALLLALIMLPVEQVIAHEVAPETRSATVKGLPGEGEASDPRKEGDEGEEADPLGSLESDEESMRSTEGSTEGDRQRSEIVEAPLPFSGLGLTGPGDEAPEIFWRALLDDHGWSDWQPVPVLETYDGPDEGTEEYDRSSVASGGWTSDAIWVGEATHLQLDVRNGSLDDIEVTFIDTAGLTESLGERALRRLRSFNTLSEAEASSGHPKIVSRAEWGADESCTKGTISYSTPRFTVIHHTASSNDYTESQAKQQVRNIYHWHTACHGSGNDWNDIGYNFLIDKFGNIYEGRRGGVDKGVIGAHAAYYNAGSFGVALMGNHNTLTPTSASMASLNTLLVWKFWVHSIPTSTSATTVHNGETIPTLVGHRNVRGSYNPNPSTTTDCPGQRLYTQLETVRSNLAATEPPHSGIGHRATTSMQVTGNGVPSTAEAVVLNVTATNPTRETFVTVWPHGITRPNTSTLNPKPGATTANEIIAKVGSHGRVNLYNHNGWTDVIVDILGYVPSGADYTTISPRRLFDTRNSSGGNKPVGHRATTSAQVTGNGVPSTAEAVVLNVTATNASQETFVTVWPHGITRPNTSTLNPKPGDTPANEIIAKVGDNGRVNIYNHRGNTDVIIDILGYVPSGADYTTISPRRLFDTRAGGPQ